MNRYSKAILGVVLSIIVLAGVYFVLSRSTTRNPSKSTPPPPVSSAEIPQLILAHQAKAPEEFAGLLAASVPIPEAMLPQGQAAALVSAMEAWLTAWVATDSAKVLSVMRESGIAPPPVWADKRAADEGVESSVRILRRVAFDPRRTAVLVLRDGEPHPLGKRPERSGTRDAARPLLHDGSARARLERREVLLRGHVTTEEGARVEVALGLEFAWDAANRRWVLIRTAWYDLPNEIEGNPPVL